ncbi:MAG: phosphatidate cytidylyltransferase [Pseudomonadota bacterium]
MAGTGPAAGWTSKFADLGVRLASSVAIGVVALTCLWLGGMWAILLAGVAVAAMLRELWHIMRPSQTESGWMFFAVCAAYVALAGLAFVWLRNEAPHGLLSVLWAAATVVAADVGGYFAGRLIGGAKLWPSVSPKKTWAGLGGAVALASLAGGLFSWATTGTYFYEVCVVSMIAALVAQGGDLAESALKRHFSVKDAGTLIPGHGGVLDRLDGHMAAILVAAAFTAWRDQAVFIW